jgi:hypothetical protein
VDGPEANGDVELQAAPPAEWLCEQGEGCRNHHYSEPAEIHSSAEDECGCRGSDHNGDATP